MTIKTCVSLITLSVNGLNFLTERHRTVEYSVERHKTEKQDPLCCQPETNLNLQTHTDWVIRWKKGIPCKRKSNENQDTNT